MKRSILFSLLVLFSLHKVSVGMQEPNKKNPVLTLKAFQDEDLKPIKSKGPQPPLKPVASCLPTIKQTIAAGAYRYLYFIGQYRKNTAHECMF